MYRGWLRLTMLVAFAVLIGLALAPQAGAAEEYPSEAGVLAGVSWPDQDLVGPDKDSTLNPLLGARLAHYFSKSLGVFGDAIYVPYAGSRLDVGDADAVTARVGLEQLFNPGKKWRFFTQEGVGWTNVSPDVGDSFNRLLLSAGFGQRWTSEGRGIFRWEIRGDRTLDEEGLDQADLFNVHALVGWSWGFGGPPNDTDGDGVPDKKDACPNTPKGCRVDEKGCEHDADGDGVCDGIDQCPDTPKGCKVDARGCPIDSDGDGVCDGLDQCPNTPKGCKVDAKGCPLDSDGDGVCDGVDQCPNTPKGCKVDAKGCPLDSDGDGVWDCNDQCPDTPRGVKVDEKGCPIPVKAPPPFAAGQENVVLNGVKFAFDSDKLLPESIPVLDQVVASLKDWPDVRIQIAGHTDSVGSNAYNQRLSERRAISVKDYLVSRGIDATRLTTIGHGENKPVKDNKTSEGRAYNRRVEMQRAN